MLVYLDRNSIILCEELPDLPEKPYSFLRKQLIKYKNIYSKSNADKYLNHIDEAFLMPSLNSFNDME